MLVGGRGRQVNLHNLISPGPGLRVSGDVVGALKYHGPELLDIAGVLFAERVKVGRLEQTLWPRLNIDICGPLAS